MIELWRREGLSGVIGRGLVFWMVLEAEYVVVRFGVRMLRAFVL